MTLTDLPKRVWFRVRFTNRRRREKIEQKQEYERTAAAEQARAVAEAEARRRARQEQQDIASIGRYPVIRLTRERFEQLPKGDQIDLATCPLDTWFVCQPFAPLPDVVVIGHVVSFQDLLVEQYGAGLLGGPERGTNRFRLELY